MSSLFNNNDDHENETTTTTPSYASATTSGLEIERAFEDALDDVHTRFLLNLPEEELSSPDRIFFQLEQAWWFYDDMICDKSDLNLPRYKTLKPFALKMFEISPILQPLRPNFDKLWGKFTLYKRTISNYGTILLNQDCTKVVLCQVWNSPSWTLPSGKVNQNEAGIDSATRETYEETGFDVSCQLGLTAQLRAANQVTWTYPLREEDGLVVTDGPKGKRRTAYVCRGVPEDFPFAPVARKEVSNVAWHDLDDIPKKSFAVLPYMSQLRRWIRKHTGNKTPKRDRMPKKSRSRNSSRSKVRGDDSSLIESGLASPGEDSGWSEEDMFAVNEKLLGRKITYDGNPHVFAEKGFDGNDPHAFHLVGGGFMNSGIRKLAPAPEQSKLQPLFRKSGAYDDDAEQKDDDDDLQPFFSTEGETPWGDVVSEALPKDVSLQQPKKSEKEESKNPSVAENSGKALLSMLQAGGQKNAEASSKAPDVFMTDAEITARSQQEKVGKTVPTKEVSTSSGTTTTGGISAREWIKDWVRNLPETPATERFGDFRFDKDKIMLAMEQSTKR